MRRFIVNLIFTICCILFMWVVASFFDINIHNDPLSKNYQNFSDWNFFILMEEGLNND